MLPDPASQDLATQDLSRPALTNVTGLDAQLQRINTVESAWSLPKLPDDVKLDLLAHPSLPNPDAISSFLWGLHSDLQNTLSQASDQVGNLIAPSASAAPLQQVGGGSSGLLTASDGLQPVLLGPVSNPDSQFLRVTDPQNQFRRIWAGIAGQPAPSVVSGNAVEDLKKQAVGAGLLPTNTTIDGSWDPQMQQIANDLSYQDFQNRVLGSKPGSVRTDSALDLINKWTNPEVLATAATALGFLPNLKAIQGNFEDFGKSHNPLDLLKGAANIAFPILNDVLLFTGVSEVVAFGRVAEMGVDAARGLDAARDVGAFGQLGLRSADVASDVERFAAPSWTARHLQPGLIDPEAAVGGIRGAAGNVLGAWREATGSLIARKAVQQSMRLGIAGQLESTLYPGLSGIGLTGAGNQQQRINQFQQAKASNPLVSAVTGALALPLMPANVFERGTFTSPVSNLYKWAVDATTSVSQDTAISALWHDLIQANADPDAVAKYMQIAQEHGIQAAQDAYLGNGDTVQAGKVKLFTTISALVNQEAERNAVALGLTKATSGEQWDEAIHQYQNKWYNLLRPIDPTVDLNTADGAEQYARQRAAAEWDRGWNPENRSGLAGYKTAQGQLYQDTIDGLRADDPVVREQNIAAAQAAIASHNNDVRQATVDFLASRADPDQLRTDLARMWPSISPDKWADFEGGTNRLEELYALGDLKFVNAKDPGGWRPGALTALPAFIDPKDLGSLKGLTSFGGSPDSQAGHFALMGLNELSRQDAAGLIGYTKTLLDRLRSLQISEMDSSDVWNTFGRPLMAKLGGADVADVTVPVTDSAVNAGLQSIQGMSAKDVNVAARELFGSTGSRAQRDYADTLRWVAQQGGDPTQALDHVQQQLDQIDRAAFWSNSNINVSDSIPLEQRLKVLQGRLKYIAGEVDVPQPIKDQLAAKGYKAVYGPDFLFPQDLTGLNGPFGDLQKAQLRRLALGRFLTNQDPNIAALRGMAFERNLAANLSASDVLPAFDYGDAESPFAVGSADLQNIKSALYEKSDQIRLAQSLADQQRAGGVIGNLGTAIQNSAAPHSIWDFKPAQVHELFDPIYGENGSKLILNALKQSRHLGWEYEGLGAIESRLRANSWLKGALQVLGKSDVADSLGEFNGFKRAGVGVLSGAFALAHGANPIQAAGVGAAGAALAGEPTPLNRVLMGAATGGAAYAATGDPLTALAAGGAGVLAGSTSGLANPRFLAGALGAGVANQAASSAGANPIVSLGAAALGGVAASQGIGYAARKGLDLFADRGWAEYSKLGDSLARMRDQMRFSLNPFFDLRRYAKSMIRGVTADTSSLGENIDLPINYSLPTLGSPDEQAAIMDRFKAATSPWYNADAADEMARFAVDRGILGFSPSRWMAGMFGHLVNQGVPDEQAANFVQNVLTYGGRTGLEKSVNFVFFPFSFEKKVMGQLARFMTDDMGRTLVLHDAVKAYELLDNQYDLSSKLRDHVPLAQDLSKLNMFTNGLSLGELGGVNRPLLEAAQSSPLGNVVDPMLNLFLPQGLHIDAGTDTTNLQKIMQRVVPAYRDMSYLLSDAAQQGHVVFSPSHLTDKAEVSAAYQEWDAFKSAVSDFAVQHGTTYDTIMRSPQYAPVRDYIEQQRALIGQKYPAWAAARAAASEKATLLQNELTDIVANPTTPAEQELAQFDQLVKSIESQIQRSTGTSFRSNPDAFGPDFYDTIRGVALALARQGQGFDGLYNRYFAPLFGPLQETLNG
jgi:hypothetical protein